MSTVSLEFFDRTESYDILQNCLNEIKGRRPINTLNHILNLSTAIIRFAILFIPMFFYNWILALALILSALPGIWMERRIGRKLNMGLPRDCLQSRKKEEKSMNIGVLDEPDASI